MTATLDRVLERLLIYSAWVSGIALFCLAAMITVDVFVRWLTGRPFIGVFEVSQVILVVVTFLAIGLVQYRQRQLRVDIFSARAKGLSARLLTVLDCVIGLAFFGLLLWTGGMEWVKAYTGEYLRRGMVEIPTAIPLAFLVIGTFFMCLTLLFRLITALFGNAEAERTGDQRSEQV